MAKTIEKFLPDSDDLGTCAAYDKTKKLSNTRQ